MNRKEQLEALLARYGYTDPDTWYDTNDYMYHAKATAPDGSRVYARATLGSVEALTVLVAGELHHVLLQEIKQRLLMSAKAAKRGMKTAALGYLILAERTLFEIASEESIILAGYRTLNLGIKQPVKV